MSYTVKDEPLDSSVQRVIINSGATDHFFANFEYFSTYEKYHHEFQTRSGEILKVYRYGNVIFCLAHFDGSEVIWSIKKVSWASSLGQNLLTTIFLLKKSVKVFLRQFHMSLKISKHGELFGMADIVDDQYFVCTTSFSPNKVSETSIINSMITISIQIWHWRMSPFGYQNLLRLPKIADGIEMVQPALTTLNQ